MRNTVVAAIAACAWIVAGCGSVKEYVPIKIGPVGMRVPNQQRLVSQAVTQAVYKACRHGRLNLKQYAGKTGRVEVNGVFPHSESDLLKYVASVVEGEMSLAGLVVTRKEPFIVKPVTVNVGPAATAADTPPAAPAAGSQIISPPRPDVRIIASLDWGGVDFTDKKYVNGGKLAGMIVVGLVTFTVGGIIWRIIESPMDHTFTLNARAHVTIRAIPTAAGLRPGFGLGEGSAQIVIDADSDSGYTANMAVPQKKQ
jgi:hypothetical protein